MTGSDVGLVITAVMSSATALGWYRSATRNQYAREREYSHILRNLEQATQAHQEIYKELDTVSERLGRLEILLLQKVGGHGKI